MFKWILLIAVIVGGGMLYVLNLKIADMERDPSKIPDNVSPASTVRVYHAYQSGVHRFVGEIKLPHSCYSLESTIVRDEKQSSIALIKLATQDKRIERVVCSNFSTGYSFSHLFDAPEDLRIKLTLDGKEFEHRIVEVAWESPVGSVINEVPGSRQ